MEIWSGNCYHGIYLLTYMVSLTSSPLQEWKDFTCFRVDRRHRSLGQTLGILFFFFFKLHSLVKNWTLLSDDVEGSLNSTCAEFCGLRHKAI